MKILNNLKLAFGGVVLATLAACGGGGGGGTAQVAETGTLKLALTDAPSCGYDSVNITVEKVRVHQSSSANDSDSGWSEVVLNPSRRINLLNLTNGVLDELGQTPLPTGKYTQLRMILAENTTANRLANSVKPTGSAEVELKTPSGQQSGVKTNINIDIAANKLADFVLDFDACKSIVSAGNSGQYLLKPVVTVIPRYISAVLGFVDPTLVGGSTSVSVQQNGVVIKATTPDSTGKFLLQPVAPGSYTLVLAAPGRTTAIITSVVVATDTVTSVNASGTVLNPPASAVGTVNGTSTLNSFVRAVQTLASGTQAEVVGRFVDGSTGAYSYALPVNAPLVAPYVVAPGVLVFTADASAAGKYTLKANLAGFADKAATLANLAAGATITTNFTFP
ncbi:MAG: DUF4382 domain-containing protein [Polaromonas sp.]|nr:DUF4382 domain-containing protein [Polaromonas sp.]